MLSLLNSISTITKATFKSNSKVSRVFFLRANLVSLPKNSIYFIFLIYKALRELE